MSEYGLYFFKNKNLKYMFYEAAHYYLYTQRISTANEVKIY